MRSDLVIVPKEPTEEMIDAALRATAAHLDIKGSQLTVNREKMRIRWRAMIAAFVASPDEVNVVVDPPRHPDWRSGSVSG
jgi:hypothetical protein